MLSKLFAIGIGFIVMPMIFFGLFNMLLPQNVYTRVIIFVIGALGYFTILIISNRISNKWLRDVLIFSFIMINCVNLVSFNAELSQLIPDQFMLGFSIIFIASIWLVSSIFFESPSSPIKVIFGLILAVFANLSLCYSLRIDIAPFPKFFYLILIIIAFLFTAGVNLILNGFGLKLTKISNEDKQD